MKRFVIVALVVILILALVGCSKYKISMEDAKNIAVLDSKADQISVSQLTAELDESSDPVVYRVSFIMHAQTITYLIDADTGEIISRTP